MFYIHPYEIGPAIEQISGLSNLRQFRHYFHCGASNRIARLLKKFRFAPALAALRKMGYMTEMTSGRETAYV